MKRIVAPAGEMVIEQATDLRRLEQAATGKRLFAKEGSGQGTQLSTEPSAGRRVEAELVLLEYGRGEEGFHGSFQEPLRFAIAKLPMERNVKGELDQAVIGQWGAKFEGVCHGHAVSVFQDIATKKRLGVNIGQAVKGL